MSESSFPLFVKDQEWKTWCLQASPSSSVSEIKHQLQEICGIPAEHQCLRHSLSTTLDEVASLEELSITKDSTLFLSGQLLGGKGGFGSLLRGSGKTTQIENEDACRDLSGRRIRVVNAEKKLQEWKANEKMRLAQKEAAKDQRKQEKAKIRTEAKQTELDDIRMGQSAALSDVAKIVERSLKSEKKRMSANESQKPNKRAKKSKFNSDSEEDSDGSDVESNSDLSEGTSKDSDSPSDSRIALPKASETPSLDKVQVNDAVAIG